MEYFFANQSMVTSWGASVLLSLSLAFFCVRLALATPLSPTLGGHRGKMRRLALESSAFRSLDPLLRHLGGLVHGILADFRRRGGRMRFWSVELEQFENRQLLSAGQPAGLDHCELVAVSCVLGLVGAGVGIYVGSASGTWMWVAPAALVFAAFPNVRLQSLTSDRFAEMSRELPAAIDLTALAMNAGSDFPGALARVIEGQDGVVAEELAQVLMSLSLGITRSAALLALRERVPIQEVRDLVRAIVLAEKKGSSVTEALVQQANSSRQRRSIRAEEAAARAGVLLLLPLMLLMACVMILLVGPLLSSGMGI